jgi:DNA polymerase III delta prime subunit
VFDELDHLTDGAQQSLRSTMDLKRCMFFFTTNNLNRIDRGIINRCHLVEMNQIVTPSAYTPLGLTILKNMGVSSDVVNNSALETLAIKARGSMRDYVRDIVKTGIEAGGIVP